MNVLEAPFLATLLPKLLTPEELCNLKKCSQKISFSITTNSKILATIQSIDESRGTELKNLKKSFPLGEMIITKDDTKSTDLDEKKLNNYLPIVGITITNSTKITFEQLTKLSKLRSLSLTHSKYYPHSPDKGNPSLLSNLINLTSVYIYADYEYLEPLTNLPIKNLTIYSMHNIDETNIKKFTHLNDLTLSYCCCPSYAFLNRFTQLTYLKIGCHSESTFLKDDDIINLTNLRNLEISIKGEITDKSIGQLTNLTSLELDVFDSNPGGGGGMPMYRLCEYNKKRLTGLGLGKLTNLIELNVRSPIDGTAIAALTNLEELEIWNRLSDVGAPHMRNLKKLKTFKWKKLDDTGDMLRTLPALRDLSIVLDLKIAKFINNLTNLTSLILHRSGDEKYIPPTRETLSKAFQNLQHLKKLEIGYMLPIIDKDLLPLKNLEILVIPNNEHITGECFSHLPLRKLNLHKNNFINDSRLAECTNLEILNIGGSINRDLEHKRNITKMSLIRLANLRKLNVCLNRTIKLEDLVSLKHLQWIHIHVKEDQTHLLQRFKDSGCKIVHCECWDMRDLD